MRKSINTPNWQVGFQRTKIIFKAYLPSVYADKRLSLQELCGIMYTVGPLQINTNDNIIITFQKQRQRKMHFKYPLCGCSGVPV